MSQIKVVVKELIIASTGAIEKSGLREEERIAIITGRYAEKDLVKTGSISVVKVVIVITIRIIHIIAVAIVAISAIGEY